MDIQPLKNVVDNQIYTRLNNVFSTYIGNQHIQKGYKITATDIVCCLSNIVDSIYNSMNIARQYVYPYIENIDNPNRLYQPLNYQNNYPHKNSNNEDVDGIFFDISNNRIAGNNVNVSEIDNFMLRITDTLNFIHHEESTNIQNVFKHILTIHNDEKFNVKQGYLLSGDNTRNYILQMFGYATQLRDTIIYLLDDDLITYFTNHPYDTIKITDSIPGGLNTNSWVYMHQYAILTSKAIGNSGLNKDKFLFNYYDDINSDGYSNYNKYFNNDTSKITQCLGTDRCLSNYTQLSAYARIGKLDADMQDNYFYVDGRCVKNDKIIVSDDNAVSENYRNGKWIDTATPNKSNGSNNNGIVGLLLGLQDIVFEINNRFSAFFSNANSSIPPIVLMYKYKIRYYFNNSGGNKYIEFKYYPLFSTYQLKDFFDLWSTNEFGQNSSVFAGIDYYWSIHGPGTYNQDFRQKEKKTIICAPKSAVANNPTVETVLLDGNTIKIYTLHLYPVFAIKFVYHFDFNNNENNVYIDYYKNFNSTYTILSKNAVKSRASKNFSNITYNTTNNPPLDKLNGVDTWADIKIDYSLNFDALLNTKWSLYNSSWSRISVLGSTIINENTVVRLNDVSNYGTIHLFPVLTTTGNTVKIGTKTITVNLYQYTITALGSKESIAPAGVFKSYWSNNGPDKGIGKEMDWSLCNKTWYGQKGKIKVNGEGAGTVQNKVVTGGPKCKGDHGFHGKSWEWVISYKYYSDSKTITVTENDVVTVSHANISGPKYVGTQSKTTDTYARIAAANLIKYQDDNKHDNNKKFIPTITYYTQTY